ncbi:hypothetical protein [Acidomonas methanolica]|uniref:hypothetical protein n=1 Tax=Acidomonas methanolica TaxID=437 RepID=UPI00211A4857|nr:hypothetical protein [Acidomonas methanolica]MCQ9155565.1 hypothetical protein [Acidomonas methanolica]
MMVGATQDKTGRRVVSRGLMAAVIVMGAMIVVGMIALTGVVTWRVTHRTIFGPTPEAIAALPVGGETITHFVAPDGTRIKGVTPRGDGTVIVRLRGGDGEQLLVWDPARGRVIARFELGE